MPKNENKVGALFEFNIDELKQGLKEAKQSISLTTSEFQKSTAGLSNWAKTSDGLGKKINELSSNMAHQEYVIANLKEQYRRVAEEQGENSEEATKLLIQINKAEATYNKMGSQLQDYQSKLSRVQASEKGVSDELAKTSNVADKATKEFQEATKGMIDWKSNSEGLSAKLKQLNTIIPEQSNLVKNLEKRYEDLVNSQDYTEEEAKALQSEWQKQKGVLNSLENDVNKYSKELDKLEGNTKKVDNATSYLNACFTVAKGVMANLVAEGIKQVISEFKDLIVDVAKFSVEYDKAMNSFQAKTGVSAKAMEQFKGEIEDLYKNNYGKSIEDVGDAMAVVAQQSKEVDPSKIKDLAKNAILLRDTFDFDVNESIRSANMLMEQFGISGDEAYTLIAQGAQKGLDKNGDLLDTVNEYAVHYKQLGYTSEEFFNSLINGSASGTFSVDKLGDAMKEFGIRAKDTANSTTEGFELIGLDADKMRDKFSKGGQTARKATEETLKALFNLDDQVKQNQAGVDLFGTMWEDLGIDGVKALMNVNGEASTTADTLKEIDEVKYDDLGSQFTQIGRSIKTNLVQPISQNATPVLKEFLKEASNSSELKEFGQDLVDVASGAIELGVKALPTVASVLKTLTPLIVAGGSALLVYNTYTKTTALLTKGATIATTAYNTVMGLFKVATTTATTATVAQTVAQTGLNTAMKMNPVGLVLSLVTALGVGLFALSKSTEDYTGVQNKEIEKTKESIKEIKEEINARQEVIDKQKEQISSNMAEMDNVANLNNELKSLVDENGKVKEGYENRVQFILNELSNATGVEVSLIDGQIKNYQDLQKEIDNTVLKKKAELILSAQEEAYTQAIENRTKAIDKQRQFQQELTKSENELKKAKEEYNKVLADPYATQLDLSMARSRMETATTEKATKEKQYNDQKTIVDGYYKDIATYEQNATLLASDNAEDWKKVINSVSQGYKDGKDSVELTLSEQIQNQQLAVQENKKLLDQDVKNGKDANDSKYKAQVEAGQKRLEELANELVTQTSTINENSPDVVNAWKSIATDSEVTFNNIISKLPPDLQSTIKNMVYTVDTDGDGVKDSFDTVAKDSVDKVANKKGNFSSAMKGNVDSVKSAVDSNELSVTGAVETLANNSVKKLDKEAEAETAGKNFVRGAKKGIDNKQEQESLLSKVAGLGSSIVKWFNNAIGNHSPSHIARKSLIYFLKGGELGLKDEQNTLLNDVKNLGSELVGTFNGELENAMSEMNTSVNGSINTLTNGDVQSLGGRQATQVVNNFYQTNNSPKALNRLEIYRQTRNLQKMYSK